MIRYTIIKRRQDTRPAGSNRRAERPGIDADSAGTDDMLLRRRAFHNELHIVVPSPRELLPDDTAVFHTPRQCFALVAVGLIPGDLYVQGFPEDMPAAVTDSRLVVITLDRVDIIKMRDTQVLSVPEQVLVDRRPDIVGNTLGRPAVDVPAIAMLQGLYPQLELILTEPV